MGLEPTWPFFLGHPACLFPQEQKQRTLSQRMRYVLSLMTIEPMMLLQGIGTNMAIIPTDQMILYKICRGKQHKVLTEDFIFLKSQCVQRRNSMWQRSFVIISRITPEPQHTATSSQRWQASTSSSRWPNILFQSSSLSTSGAGVIVLEGLEFSIIDKLCSALSSISIWSLPSTPTHPP